MVKTMESKDGQMSGFEMPYDSPDGLDSDFSVISHPTTNDGHININYEHLQHLNLSGVDLEQPQTTHDGVQPEPSLSNTVIQQHLEQIVKENMELKEALQQNNSTLRQHFQTLLTWQEQQTKARIRHKQMLEDMQQASLSIQREKESLLSKVDELGKCSEANAEELKKQNAILEAKDLKISELNTQLERQEVGNLQLEQQLKEALADCEQLRADISRLRKPKEVSPDSSDQLLVVDDCLGYSVIHHSGFNAENTKEEIERLESSVAALQEGKALAMKLLADKETEFKELREKFDKSQTDIASLQQELETNRSTQALLSPLIAGPPDQKWDIMEAGIVSSTTDFQAAVNCLQKYGQRFSSIDEQLGECQRRLTDSIQTEVNVPHMVQLRDEVESLRRLLRIEQENKEIDRKNLQESQFKFDALHKEYKVLMKQWHEYQAEMQTKSRQLEALAQIEKRQNQEQLDEVTAKLMMQEEVIQDKERERLHLKNRVDILSRETEQIPMLRAQVELFQQKLKKKEDDFKKNESLAESQKRDIHSLQAQVVQLMDEINHQNQSQVMQLSGQPQMRSSPSYERRASQPRGTSSAPHSRRQSAERHVVPLSARPLNEQSEEGVEERAAMMECPKCRLKFTSLTAVENHVELCCFGPDSIANPFL